MEPTMGWVPVSRELPPEGVVVGTKSHDTEVERIMVRWGSLWFIDEGAGHQVVAPPKYWRSL